MAQASVQPVRRGTGFSAALVDAIQRDPFEGVPLAVLKGQHSDADKLRTAFFSDKSKATTVALTGQSVELEEEWPGGAIYTASIGVAVSTPTVNTEIDTLHRLHDWLAGAVSADPNLAGTCIHAAVTEVDFVQRPGTRRVMIEAVVDVQYERAR